MDSTHRQAALTTRRRREAEAHLTLINRLVETGASASRPELATLSAISGDRILRNP
jgi:hypothetical protein